MSTNNRTQERNMSHPGVVHLIAAAVIITRCGCSYAGSVHVWDGTWTGTVNKTEPVSLTVSDGKVTGYTIRGVSPFAIESFVVTRSRVEVHIGADYYVTVT